MSLKSKNAPPSLSSRIIKLKQLSDQIARRAHSPLPFSLIVMSDDARLPNLEDVICALPKGCAVIFRNYSDSKRAYRAKAICALAKARGVHFLVAGDPQLVHQIGADGLHCPSWFLSSARKKLITQIHQSGHLVSAACHNETDYLAATRLGVDFALLSPLWPTKSHGPNHPYIGIREFSAIARHGHLPVFALGGITIHNSRYLGGKNISGLAAISPFIS